MAVGHQVDLLTNGFERYGRILRLLSGAMRNLQSQCEDPSMLRRASCYVAISETQDYFDVAELTARAARLAGWSSKPDVAAVSSGRVALAELAGRAIRDMNSGQNPFALLAAVDTLLDESTLSVLHEQRRLKNPALASGLMPGEAAVLLLLGPDGLTSPAALEFVLVCNDQQNADAQMSLGKGLCELCSRAQESVGWPDEELPWIISDDNGEANRALEWGYAMSRLRAENPVYARSCFWHPVASFGDAPAANMALGMGQVMAAWSRGYAVASTCAIFAGGEDTLRAVMVFRKNHAHN